MSTILGIDNSIGWAHWKLKGGLKNLIISSFGYFVVIVGIIILTLQPGSRTYERDKFDTLSNWRVALLAFQAAMLLLLAGSRVAVAIRGDIANHMLESHALMPVPPLSAISGYIWGPVTQVIGLIIANLIIGLFVCLSAGLNLGLWFGPNLQLMVFAIFVWVVAAYSAFTSRFGWGAVFGLLITVGFSQGILLPLIPGLMVLAGPFVGRPVFMASISNYEISPAHEVSFLAQALVGSILYFGAARKYRRQDQSALGVLPGMLLLGLWCVVTGIGIHYMEDFRARPYFGSDRVGHLLAYLLCGISSAVVVALVPIANAARERHLRMSAPMLAALAGLLISGICLFLPELHQSDLPSVALTFTVLASFLVAVSYLLQIAYRVMRRAWAIGIAWLFIMWVVPVLVDFAMWSLRDDGTEYEMTIATAISPIGSLVILWTDELTSDPHRILAVGIAVQVALAIGCMLLFHFTQRRPHAAARISD